MTRYLEPPDPQTWKRATPRRNRCAGGTTDRGIDRARQELVLGAAARCHGGGGQRPQPTPPSGSGVMLCDGFASLRLCVSILRWCDASVLAMSSVPPCLCGSTAMPSCAMSSCLRAFVVATLRWCDASAPLRLCASALYICDVRRAMALRLRAFAPLRFFPAHDSHRVSVHPPLPPRGEAPRRARAGR